MADQNIKLIIEAILKDKDFQSRIKGMRTQFEKTSASSDILKKGIGLLSGVISVGFAAQAVRKAITVAREFEKSIANVSAVSGDSKEALAALAREAGKTTVFSAREAADAMYFLASAGLAAKDMAEVLNPTLNLAAATQTGIAEATDMVVNNLKAFSAEMSEAGEYAGIMAQTVRSSNTNMEQLGQALSYASSEAALTGISFQDLNVLIGGLADIGIKGSRAGMQLRQVFARLGAEIPQVSGALEKYGITQQEINDLLPTPLKLFERLRQANISTSDATKIFGVRNKAVFALIKNQLPNLEKLNKKYGDVQGTLQEMVDKQLNTLDGQLKLLNSAWQELILTVTQTEGLKDFVKQIRLVISHMQEGIDYFDEWKQDWIDIKDRIVGVIKIISYNLGVFVDVAKKTGKVAGDAIAAGLAGAASKIPIIGKKFKASAESSQKALNNSYVTMISATKKFSVDAGVIHDRTGTKFGEVWHKYEGEFEETVTQGVRHFGDGEKEKRKVLENNEKQKTEKLKEELKKRFEAEKQAREDYKKLIEGEENIEIKKIRNRYDELIALAGKRYDNDLINYTKYQELKLKADQWLDEEVRKINEKHNTDLQKMDEEFLEYLLGKDESELIRLEEKNQLLLETAEKYYEDLGLTKEQADEHLFALENSLQKRITELQDKQRTEREAKEKKAANIWEKALERRKSKYANVAESMMDMTDTFVDSYLNGIEDMESSFEDIASSIVKGYVKLIVSAIEMESKKLYAQALAAAANPLTAAAAPGMFGAATAMLGVAGGVKAIGGSVATSIKGKKQEGGFIGEGGSYLVGERGPELVNLPVGANIMSNADLMGGIVNNDNRKATTNSIVIEKVILPGIQNPDQFLEWAQERANSMNANLFGSAAYG